ncbi:hypothetical protein TELCIR_25174, partial [Teladorsagia circumcincta]
PALAEIPLTCHCARNSVRFHKADAPSANRARTHTSVSTWPVRVYVAQAEVS